MAKFNHDFLGRAAVEAEAQAPRRTIATLVWNSDDIVDIYSSLFRPGEAYKPLELPLAVPNDHFLAHADHILKDGREVGYASGVIYSYYYRQVISHAVIDIDQAQMGNEVTVQWGDFGGRIKNVRARVERYPYLDTGRNQNFDMSQIPSGVR